MDDKMTLRDQLAAACLPAIYEHFTKLTDRAAELAYEQADEMLKARKSSPGRRDLSPVSELGLPG